VGQLHLSGSQVSWQPHSPLLTFDPFSVEADALTWSSDGQYVAAISNNATPEHQLVVWKWNNGAQVLSPVLPDSNTPLTTLAWSPDGALLAVGNNKGVVYVWDVQMTGASASLGSVRAPKLFYAGSGAAKHTKAILDVEWSPDGRYIASASADNTVIVWKVDAN